MTGPAIKTIQVKTTRELGRLPKTPEDVILVPKFPADVGPGDTVEILLNGKDGFTVYLPYGGHFNAQIFEAIRNPEWALAEMASSEGGGESSNDVWGVRMTRTSGKGAWPQVVFPFCIFSKEFQTFAVGGSPPKMNLNP